MRGGFLNRAMRCNNQGLLQQVRGLGTCDICSVGGNRSEVHTLVEGRGSEDFVVSDLCSLRGRCCIGGATSVCSNEYAYLTHTQP